MESWSELPQILRLFAALAFVLALMGILALALKKLGLSGASAATPKQRRLKIVESLPLDPRRRLVLLQRDDKQHLVILGASGETVIENDIQPKEEENEKSA